MSVRPKIARDGAEPFGTPWAGLTAQAAEASDAPPVEANRTVRDNAEPVETAELQPATSPAQPKRPGRKALIGGLALSVVLHAAALAFFLDRLTRSGMEAETEDAISVEIVVDAPPQPTVAGSGSGGAEAVPADAEEEVQVEEKTATVDDPVDAPTATVEEQEPERTELAESVLPPPPDPTRLQVLAKPPPVPIEPPVQAVEEPRTNDDLTAPPPPAETATPPLEAEPAPPEIAILSPDLALPPETEVPVPTPRPEVEEAKQPAAKPEASEAKKAETAVNKAVPLQGKSSKAAETKSAGTAKQKQAKIARTEPTSTGRKAATSKRKTVSAAGAAGAVGGGSTGALAQYARSLNRHVQRHMRYPDAARQRITATTRLAIIIDRSGRLSSVRVAGSSGQSILDEEALAVARRAAPYPPPPEGVGKSTFAFTVSLRFKP